MNFEQKWLRIILAVVIAVVGHAIAVMRLKSVFVRAKLTLHSLDGRFFFTSHTQPLLVLFTQIQQLHRFFWLDLPQVCTAEYAIPGRVPLTS